MEKDGKDDIYSAPNRDTCGYIWCPSEGFLSSLIWMKELASLICIQQKCRIVIDYDPAERQFRTEVFAQADESDPEDNR